MAKIDMNAIIGRLSKRAKEMPVFQAFGLFNLVLILGLGGVLHLLRAATDEYSAVEPNFLSIGFVSIAYCAVVVTFAGLFLSSKANTGLRNVGALVVAAGFLEILGSGFPTYHNFTLVPRSHRVEDSASIMQYISSESRKLPEKINDDVALENMYVRGHAIVLTYSLKEKQAYGYDENAMREELQRQTCQWFREYKQYPVIETLTHIFTLNQVAKYTFSIHKKDCATVEPAVQPHPPSRDGTVSKQLPPGPMMTKAHP